MQIHSWMSRWDLHIRGEILKVFARTIGLILLEGRTEGCHPEMKWQPLNWGTSSFEAIWLDVQPSSCFSYGRREIRIECKVLNIAVNDQDLDDEGVDTVVSEAEVIINSRSLTFISYNPGDLEALTTSYLLLQRRFLSAPLRNFIKKKVMGHLGGWSRTLWTSFGKVGSVRILPSRAWRHKWLEPESAEYGSGKEWRHIQEALAAGACRKAALCAKDGFVGSVETGSSAIIRLVYKIFLFLFHDSKLRDHEEDHNSQSLPKFNLTILILSLRWTLVNNVAHILLLMFAFILRGYI